MQTLVFGHAGAKLIVFPTSFGTCWEWPDRRMHHVLGDHLENGALQMICVDQVHTDGGWYSKWAHPGARAWRQLQYDAYLREEVVPLTYARNPNAFFITAGASFGAYDAMTFGLRNPDVVRRIIGMSGMYDIRGQTAGYSDANVYQVNPVEFIPNEHEPGRSPRSGGRTSSSRWARPTTTSRRTTSSRGCSGGAGSATRCASGRASRTTGPGGSG
jgi:esterase/lipase superfamily enzyme